MEKNNKKEKKNNKLLKILKNPLMQKIIILIIVAIASGFIAIGIKDTFITDSKTTKIGFENIGEFATQSAYCTQINVTDSSRELFGNKIPFTQSKYIYSYNITIKAGYDFSQIQWNIKGDTIEVKLPEVKILSSEIDLDSFKVYHEEESIFNKITLSENNQALKKLQSEAQTQAIQNGLYDNARKNAETMLKSFFGNVYDLNKYKIVFIDK
ncbi:DUF4230 domain-containing protein [Anaerofustis stercorihominis]|uniref:DUF4230 domain-containing protein n=1 Tax=Anaerofustis stercorihominis TaxID=214853 RepID=UPI001106517D|nr:DUF4230 domain-containing protein [Anaerofustis stercorihominis]